MTKKTLILNTTDAVEAMMKRITDSATSSQVVNHQKIPFSQELV